MNKMVIECWNGEELVVGTMETVKWTSMKWSGGPKKDGFYLVSDGKGAVHTLGYVFDGKRLFERYMDGSFESARFSNGGELTDENLIALYKQGHVWYDISTGYMEDYGEVENLMIISEEDKPKYFMETGLKGPIDLELDTYDKTFVDLELNIVTKKEEA